MIAVTVVHHASTAAVLATTVVLGTAGPATATTSPGREASPAAVYVVALNDQRLAVDPLLRQIGSPRVLYRFGSALQGFAAVLTPSQVTRLESEPGVALVERSIKQHTDSASKPVPADLREAMAASTRTGGPRGGGRGIVVGVVDSGIWPENPSFAALPDVDPRSPAGFSGACAPAEQWDPADCNSKIVSARYFVNGFGADNLAASEYLSPRDGSGHGSRTAAVAAGDDEVRVRVEGQDFGETSGVAPDARIAVYKACWSAPQPDDDGCTTADTVAAVDRAVADGVDVISYAISGRSGRDSRALELAFLNATSAGVLVAASAGDRGPAPGTVANATPWLTTVGASVDRKFQGALVLGGRRYVGAMVSDQHVRRAGIVLSEDAAAPGARAESARLCRPGALDAAVVQGKVVVCDRGRIARVEKSAAVARAGGVGMVLANVRAAHVAPDFHAVPTVNLALAAADEVKRYVRRVAHPTASLDPTASDDVALPRVAAFSSRGPAPRGGHLVKPDVTAPGVAVLSAVAPPLDAGRRWDMSSGTSTATAHVAGLAAVVMAERPGWTPAMVKSAMSTTAGELEGAGRPLSAGAGQVDPDAAIDPGLALDAPTARFRAWLAGRVPTRNLNLPSIAVGELTGRSRVVRRVTNVSGRTETYTAHVHGLAGVDMRVRPSWLRLRPGETRRFAVVFNRRTATLGKPAQGYLSWSGSSHEVRMPVVVTPRAMSVRREASGSGETGSVALRGVSGLDGTVDVHASGLVPAKPVGLTLEPGRFDRRSPRTDADTARFAVDVQPGSRALRIELQGRATDHVDLHLYREGRLVASATGRGDEVLTRVEPEPGRYEVYVSSVVAENRSTTTSQLYTWVLPRQERDNLSLPQSVPLRAGEPFKVRLGWSRLDATSRWFGEVRYGASGRRTFVTIN